MIEAIVGHAIASFAVLDGSLVNDVNICNVVSLILIMLIGVVLNDEFMLDLYCTQSN